MKLSSLVSFCRMAMVAGVLFSGLSHAELVSQTQVVDGKLQMIVKSTDDNPPPQLGISPPGVTASTTGRYDTSITLYNYADHPKTMQLSLLGEDGKDTPLQDWTIISPDEFVIPKQGYQVIRLSIRPPSDAQKREYNAVLFIKETTEKPKTNDEGDGISMYIGSNYALPIHLTLK